MLLDKIWEKTFNMPTLVPNTIHIWCQSFPELTAYHDFFYSSLSNDELEQTQKFLYSQDKLFYVITRGFLRYLLSHYLDASMHDLCFTYNAHKKPELLIQHNARKLTFNLSHAHEILLIAVSDQPHIGIDVELMQDNFDILSIAKNFFTIQEYQDLIDLPAECQKHRFFSAWTRKEAALKALGTGWMYSAKDLDAIQQFSIASIPIMTNYYAALASVTDLRNISIKYFNFSGNLRIPTIIL